MFDFGFRFISGFFPKMTLVVRTMIYRIKGLYDFYSAIDNPPNL